MAAPHDANPAVQAVRLRITRLSATGAPVTGPGNGYVMGGIIQLQDSPETDPGTPIEVRQADGVYCVNRPGTQTIKWRNLELSICGVEDEAFELIEGALLIQSGGATTGHADPALGQEANPNGIAIETWAKMVVGGSVDPTFPWLRVAYFKTYDWIRGQQTFLNGHDGWIFTGKGVENPGMRATGPFGDWGDAASVGRVRGVYRTAVDPPAGSVGYVAVP